MRHSGKDEIQDAALRQGVQLVAKDARNVLVLVRAYAERLEQRYGEEAFREELRALIDRAAARIDGALVKLERLSLLGSTRPEAVDLSPLLEALLARRAETLAERELIVLRELDHVLPPVWGDRGLLEEGFDSLLSCVLALAPRHGDLYVSAREETEGAGSWGVTVSLRFRLDHGWDERGEPVELGMGEALMRAQGASFELQVEDELYLCIAVVLPLALES